MESKGPEVAVRSLMSAMQESYPVVAGLLNPGASEDEMCEFERGAGVQLPPELRCVYRLFNGETDLSDGLFGGWRWLPLSELQSAIAELRAIELDFPSDKNYPINDAIPFLSYEGEVLYLDSSKPCSTIHIRYHEGRQDHSVMAQNLEQLLYGFIEKIRKKEFQLYNYKANTGMRFHLRLSDRELWPYCQEVIC